MRPNFIAQITWFTLHVLHINFCLSVFLKSMPQPTAFKIWHFAFEVFSEERTLLVNYMAFNDIINY